MSIPSLDFYFFVGSTYTYLTVSRIHKLAAAQSVEIHWYPFNARTIMIEQNNRPFVDKPVKLNYMWRDLERRAQRYGIEFTEPPPYPTDKDNLAGLVATLAAREGWCPDFVRALYKTWFVKQRDPGNVGALSKLLEQIDKNAEQTITVAQSDEIKALYDQRTNQARELGIFGSPSFHIDGGNILGR